MACLAEDALGKVVLGGVVGSERERRRAGGCHSVVKGGDDGSPGLLRPDMGPDQCGGVGVDDELEVQVESLTVQREAERGAVFGPLSAGEEGLKRLSERLLIGPSPRPARRPPVTVDCEHLADTRVSPRDFELSTHGVGECGEAALPLAPEVEDGRDAALGDGIVGRRLRWLGRRARLRDAAALGKPVVESGRRDGERVPDVDVLQLGVLAHEAQDQGAEAVAIVAPVAPDRDGAGVCDQEVDASTGEGGRVWCGLHGRCWPSDRAHEPVETRLQHTDELVGAASSGAGGGEHGGGGRRIKAKAAKVRQAHQK